MLNPNDLAADAGVIKMIKLPIRVVDRQTAVIETHVPQAALVDTLAQSLITLIPDSGEVKKWGKDYTLHPSGTGPFKYVEWAAASTSSWPRIRTAGAGRPTWTFWFSA